MQAITEQQIRSSFVNCTKGETQRLNMPADLAALPWDELDFLGWRDPRAPDRAYLVAEHGSGLTGVAFRLAALKAGGRGRQTMCSLCLTTHPGSGVVLMTARRSGKAGQQYNSVGTYICSDLDCSLYLRGKKFAGPRIEESLTTEQKIDRAKGKLAGFLDTVVARPKTDHR